MSKVKNREKVFSEMKKLLEDEAHKEVKFAIARATEVVRSHAVLSIARGAKTGQTYRKYNPNRTHTASAPGQPPATDTGFLISQITGSIKKEKNAIIGEVISSAPYSKFLEFGTVNMAARPFMQPALEANRKKIVEIFKQEGVLP